MILNAVLGLFAMTAHAAAVSSTNVKHVRLLEIADTHAQLETHWDYLPSTSPTLQRMGGYARIKTVLDEARKSAPGAVFSADGGDTFQGSALAAWTSGQAVVGPLNALNLDIGVPGNWEVVYGPDAFKKLMSEVNYKVLCYNFEDVKTGKRLFEPATVIDRGGVRVAFVGLTDPTTTIRQPPEEVAGLDSTRVQGLRAFIQELKRNDRPDLVVLVSHAGLAPNVRFAEQIPEIDVVLSAHTHERTAFPFRAGHALVVEPGSLGSFVGQLDLTVRDGEVASWRYKLIPVLADQYKEDAAVKAQIEKEKKPFAKRLAQVVGHTKGRLMRYDVLNSDMDDVVADATREALGTDVAFTNGFRYAPPIPPGPITEGDLWSVLPLDARLKSGTVSGSQLRRYLEHELDLVFAKDPMVLSGGWGPRPSGMTMRFAAGKPAGERLLGAEIAGQVLDDGRRYTLGGCERPGEQPGMICRLPGVADPKAYDETIHGALQKYLRTHDPLPASYAPRAEAVDLSTTVFSQFAMLDRLWGDSTRAPALADAAVGGEFSGPDHRVILEVTSSKPKDWQSAVRRIQNLRKSLRGDTEIELVAYGPGLSILARSETTVGNELSRLADLGVRLAACSNSMKAMKVEPSDLIAGALPVDAGVAESVRRQEQGWSVLRIGAE